MTPVALPQHRAGAGLTSPGYKNKNKGQVHKSIVFERSVGIKPGIFLPASSAHIFISILFFFQVWFSKGGRQ